MVNNIKLLFLFLHRNVYLANSNINQNVLINIEIGLDREKTIINMSIR
jgi:hypothetical protein